MKTAIDTITSMMVKADRFLCCKRLGMVSINANPCGPMRIGPVEQRGQGGIQPAVRVEYENIHFIQPVGGRHAGFRLPAIILVFVDVAEISRIATLPPFCW